MSRTTLEKFDLAGKVAFITLMLLLAGGIFGAAWWASDQTATSRSLVETVSAIPDIQRTQAAQGQKLDDIVSLLQREKQTASLIRP